MSKAYISSSIARNVATKNKVGAVTVTANDTSTISALVAAVAASVSFGGTAGVGVAIGVSVAFNQITDGSLSGVGALSAYMLGTPVQASGLVDVEANSTQTISATTVAGAVGIAGGGAAGVGVSGAGVSDFNVVAIGISAYINGGTTIASGGVKVAASDASGITALVGAASVAGGFGGAAGVAVSIGLSIAQQHDQQRHRGLCHRRRIAVERRTGRVGHRD